MTSEYPGTISTQDAGADAAPGDLAPSRAAPAPAAAPVPPAPMSTSARGDGATGLAAPSVANGGTPVTGSQLSQEELDELTEGIVAALKTVTDPEIPADIYELGLIYRIDIADDRVVTIDMTLTTAGCPVAGEMPGWVENAVNSVPGVMETRVHLVFDPPWDKERMSDEAKLAIGMY